MYVMFVFLIEEICMSVQKIKIVDLINSLVFDAKNVESSDIPQYEKTKKFKALASSFISQMYSDGRRKESNRIALTTARGYLTKARKAIAEFTGLHHRFDAEISRLIKKYPHHSELLTTILALDTQGTRLAKKSLLETLTSSLQLSYDVDNLDFSKRNISTKVEQLCLKYPAYRVHLEALNDKANVMAAKIHINKTINEIKPLFSELKAVKVDHELIVNLALSEADKSLLSNKASDQLRKKKTSVVYVDHPKLIQAINTILSNPSARFNGLVNGIAPLTFALCAATGRRPIEVLYTGSFVAKNKNNLIFSGQAKKRDEADEEKERVIYSLVDSALVVEAFNVLRDYPVLKKLVSESLGNDYRETNDIINGKTACYLNDFAKDFFIDKKRVFKDTRGIYGRICYQTWYLQDPRWRDVDEDIFFYELFGHGDTNAQAHYKPYKLNNFQSNFVPGQPVNIRWEKLCQLDGEMESLARGTAAIEIHNFVKDAVVDNEAIEITQSMLTRGTGKFRGTIKNYLDAIGDLALPGEPLTVQHEVDVDDNDDEELNEPVIKKIQPKAVKTESEKPAKKLMPHVSAKKLTENNHWQVIIKLGNKTSSYDIYESSRMAAMKLGYDIFCGIKHEYEVTIPFIKGHHFKETLYAKSKEEAGVIALNDAGLDGMKGNYGKIKVIKL